MGSKALVRFSAVLAHPVQAHQDRRQYVPEKMRASCPASLPPLSGVPSFPAESLHIAIESNACAFLSRPPPAAPLRHRRLVRDPLSPEEVNGEAAALRQEQRRTAERLSSSGADPAQLRAFPKGSSDGACVNGADPDSKATSGTWAGMAEAAVVMVTFDRADYLGCALQDLLAVRARFPNAGELYPAFVSQDGDAAGVQAVVRRHLDRVRYLEHAPDRPIRAPSAREKVAYYRIAQHYKFLLKTLFDCFGFPRAIVVEDDMRFAPDFFAYFDALAPVLDEDSSLLCASAWNDNGMPGLVSEPTAVERSDFFPGLGWMTTRSVWRGLRGRWPAGYWDDWLRTPEVRQGRQCLRPEVARTSNFGRAGSSEGQYFDAYIAPIQRAAVEVNWGGVDLEYLVKDAYEARMQSKIAAGKVVESLDDALAALPEEAGAGGFIVAYEGQEEYSVLARRLKILPEFKVGRG